MKLISMSARVSSFLLFLIITNIVKADAISHQSCQLIRASGNAEYPPYLWRPENSTKLTGAIAFLLDDLAVEIKTEIELAYSGPWGRVLDDVASGRIDMVAGAFFTLPRTHYMDYTYPPMLLTKTAVWVNTANLFPYTQWDDLKAYRGITVINNSFGQAFDEYAKQQLIIDEVASLEQGFRMLSAGRVDYLIYEKTPGTIYAQKLNITNVLAQPLELTRQNLYLTMAKQSACNSAVMRAKISKALNKFAQEQRSVLLLERAHSLWINQ